MKNLNTIKSQLRRAFTIVELVVVIAVIAALAAILIPTFVNVVNSANESNDMITIKNLNTAVATEDTLSGVETVSDAIDAALANGYSVSNLSPTSDGNIIVYDQESKRFALLSEDLSTVVYADASTTKTNFTTYTTWVFATTGDATVNSEGEYVLSGTNSYILTGSEWNGVSVTANYGVELYDLDPNTMLDSVTITNTDSTTDAGNVSLVKSVKTAADESATVNEIISITSNVKAKSLTYTGTAYSLVNYSTISVITKISVGDGNTFTIRGTSKVYAVSSGEIYVAAAQNENTYLTDGEGNAYEGEVKAANDSYVQNMVKTSLDLEAINKASADGEVSAEDVITAVTVGLGTENYPYLIYDEDDFYTIFTNESSTCLYYRLLTNIDNSETTDGSPYIPKTDFVLDGNGYTYTGYLYIGDVTDVNVTIRNLTYIGTSDDNSNTGGMNLTIDVTGDVIISNCTIKNGSAENLVKNTVLTSTTLTLWDINSVTIENCSFEKSRICISAANVMDDNNSQTELPITIKNTSFTGGDSYLNGYIYGLIYIETDASNCKVNGSSRTFTVNISLEDCLFSGEIKYGIYYESDTSIDNEKYVISLKNVSFDSTFSCLNDSEHSYWTFYALGNYSDYICPSFIYDVSSQSTSNSGWTNNTSVYNKLTLTTDNCTFSWKLNVQSSTDKTVTVDATNMEAYNNLFSKYGTYE